MEDVVATAIAMAAEAHKGQKDKCGQSYIHHPLRVMMMFTAEYFQAVAVLHDVVEDTDLTLKDLKIFPDEIVAGVDAMTKRKGEQYQDYLSRVSSDPIARHVKQADIRDNGSPSRLYKLSPDQITRLTNKYSTALKFLERQCILSSSG